MTRRRSLAAVVLSALAACADAEGARPEAVIADSAGARIVTYDLAQVELPTRWQLGEPDLEIGELEGPVESTFSRVIDLATTPDGSVIVSDAASPNLRVFDAQGRSVRAFGVLGEGPEEFGSPPTIAGVSGDSLFLFDGRSGRLSTFLSSGELVDAITVGAVRRPIGVTRLTDGTYLSRSRWIREGEPGFYEPRIEVDSMVLERLDRTGTLIDTVGVVPERSMARTVRSMGDRVSIMQAETPFATRSFVRTDGSRVLVGWSEVFELTWIDGAERTVLRITGLDDRSSAAAIRAHQDSLVAASDQEIDPMTRRLMLDFAPDRLPAFGDVVVGEGGETWVAMTGFDLSRGLDWLVFSPAGILEGTVHTPPELRVRVIGSDHIIGIVPDSLDVPYVRRYPLVAEPGS